MDTLPSTAFQPIQPDGFVLGSPPGREAPKIEITETDTVCHSPLSPSASAPGDLPLTDWDDLHHYGDSAGPGDYLTEQSPRHGQGESRGVSLSRRGDGGPGKSPSPSRNSPRRHSPVPYSPNRQHRPRHSEDSGDVSLSPRRHSPVSVSVPLDGPCSLPLAVSAPEEFICVSYTDPFSSPTLSNTSGGILSISILYNQDAAAGQDVEMTPNDDDNHDDTGEMKDSSGHAANGMDVRDSTAETDCSLVEGVSVTTRTSVVEEGGGQEDASRKDGLNTSNHPASTPALRDMDSQSPSQNDKVSAVSNEVTSSDGNVQSKIPSGNEVHSDNIHRDSDARLTERSWVTRSAVGGTEAMEGEDSFHDSFHEGEVSSSESSSDDDMDHMMSPSPCVHGLVSVGPAPGVTRTSASPCSVGSCFRSVNPHLCQSDSASQREYSQSFTTPNVSSTVGCQGCHQPKQVSTSEGDLTLEPSAQTDTNSPMLVESQDTVAGLSSSADCQSSDGDRHAAHPSASRAGGGDSLSDPHTVTGSCSCSLSPCPSRDASPRKTCPGASKTAEDFALPRVVGHPPLHFPHGRDVLLVHCALPSPYDPHLPTPPIVLTPHSSYDDLDINDDMEGNGDPPSGSVTRDNEKGSNGDFQRPSISRSRSFPRLQHVENEQFEEPHQVWPVLGEPASHRQDTGVDSRHDNSCTGSVTNTPSSASHQSHCSMEEGCDASGSASLPGSPCSSRAAVIGRLRRVVERRLSSTSDTLEAALQDGASP